MRLQVYSMVEEIEAKVLEVEPEKVYDRLREIGAEKVFDSEIESEFYDFPDDRIEQQGTLRLRREGDRVYITGKKDLSRDGAKRMEEYEFFIDGMDDARSVLTEIIGLEKVHESSKHRTKWEKGNVEYVVDEYPGIPPLLEVEAPGEEELRSALEELGYTMEETVSWDARELQEHYDGA